MAIEKDARFDVRFVDTPDGVKVNESLGLVLEERGGALGFATQLISPYAGQLAQGDLQDKDLTRGTVQTQRSWRKGRGQTQLLEDPAKFSDGYADSRFDGQLMLPPEPRSSAISGSNDPSYSGSATTGAQRASAQWGVGGRSNTTRACSVSWSAGARVNTTRLGSVSWGVGSRVTTTRQASVNWGAGGRSAVTRQANVNWGAGSRSAATDQVSATWTLATIDNPNNGQTTNTNTTNVYYASFIPKQTFTLNTVQIYLEGGKTLTNLFVKADNAGTPDLGAPLAFTSGLANGGGSYAWTQWTLGSPITCTAGVRYWIGLVPSSFPTGVGYDGTQNGLIYGGSIFVSGPRFSFLLNGGLQQDDQKTQVRRAQSFVIGGSNVTVTQLQIRMSSSTWETAPSGSVAIYNNSGGSPGSQVATATLTNPGAMGWKTYALSVTLTAGATYWIVVEVDASNSSNEAVLNWEKDANGNYSGGSSKSATWSGGSWGAWTATTGDYYFIVNTIQTGAPYFYTLDETKARVAQRMATVGSNTGVTQIQVQLSRSAWVGSPDARLRVYQDSGSAPNGSLIATSSAIADPGASAVWVTVPISFTLTAGVSYWVSLEVDSSADTTNATINWHGDVNASYGLICNTGAATNDTWGGWSVVNNSLYFVVNTIQTGAPYFYTKDETRVHRGQKFVAASGVTVTQVQVPISRSAWTGSPDVRLRIYNDSAGNPGTVIGSSGALTDPGASIVWVTVSISAGLIGGSTYYLMLEVDSSSDASNATLNWQGDGAFTYAQNTRSMTLTNDSAGAWGAENVSLYFVINTLQSGAPYFYTKDETRVMRAQRFVTTGAVTVTQVQIPISRSVWTSSPDVRLRIYTESAGNPGTVVASSGALTDPGASIVWVTVSISASLSASTAYYLVLDVNSTVDTVAGTVNWQGDSAFTYAQSARSMILTNDNTGTWVSESVSLYFVINTLQSGAPYFYTKDEARIIRGQRFVTTGAITVTQVQIPISQSVWTGSPDVRLRIYNESAGNPGTVVASSGAMTNPGTGIVWVTVAISASLAASTAYYLILDVNSTVDTVAATVNWQMDGNFSYGQTIRSMALTNDNTAAWTTANLSFYFIINAVASGNPFFYTHDRTRVKLAESFTPSANVTVTFLRFFAQLIQWSAAGTATIGIYANSAGDPGSAVATATLSTAIFTAAGAVTGANWVQVSLSASLTNGTTYWVLIDCDAPAVGDVVLIDWRTDPAAGYAGAAKSASSNSNFTFAAWATQAVDFWFSINNGTQLPSAVTVNPVRFSGQLYVSSGASIYRYDAANNIWNLVNTAAVTVTALAAFAGTLYAALGDSNDVIYSTTGSSGAWSNTISARRYTYLRAHNGYLWGVKAAGGSAVLGVSPTPTTLTSWEDLTVATSDVPLTGLVGFQNVMMVLSARGLFEVSSRYVSQAHDWSVDEGPDNGKNSIVWVADGRLHIPLRSGLNAYDGVRMVPVGPDIGEGLPVGEQGRIAAQLGTRTWLFAAIDAGTTGRSSIYAYNGEGWHCLVKASAVGKRIRALFLECITSTVGYARLWYFEDALPYYVEFPDSTDNPRKFSGLRYSATGTLTSTRMGGELAQINKELHNLIVVAEDCAAGQTVEVYVDANGADNWLKVGTVSENGSTRFELYAPAIDAKLCGAGCTSSVIVITNGSTNDMSPGQFVRIGKQHGQVKTVDSGTQFTLVHPLASAPVIGDNVYGSVPVGVDFRYRLTMKTTDATKTPVVRRVSMKWREQMIAKSRMFTLTVPIDDGQVYRTAGDAEVDAATFSAALDVWCERETAFVMVDPRGANYWVKVTSAQESEWVRTRSPEAAPMALRTRKVVQLEQVR